MPFGHVIGLLIGFVLVVGFNVSLLMGEIARYKTGIHLPSAREISLYAVLFFFNAGILFPAICQTRRIKIVEGGLEVSTLWIKSKLNWQDIVEFRNPSYLTFAMIRTPRFIYLINKARLSNFSTLDACLSSKLKGRTLQSRKS
jgi:hypothetical protein